VKAKGIIILLSILLKLTLFAQESNTRGYQGIIEAGGGIVFVHDRIERDFKADFINGYRFNDNISIGLGVGVRKYSTDEEFIPLVYLNFRANLGYNRFEKFYPYVQTGLGYPLLSQSVGLAFKNAPIAIGICGEIVPIIGSTLFTSIGVKVGISF
jgi:opacity protein-like surface antigen